MIATGPLPRSTDTAAGPPITRPNGQSGRCPGSSVRRVAGAALPSAAYTRGSMSVPVNDQWAWAKPRADTTRMMVGSSASKAAVTAALNRIPTMVSAGGGQQDQRGRPGLMVGQAAFRYWLAAIETS